MCYEIASTAEHHLIRQKAWSSQWKLQITTILACRLQCCRMANPCWATLRHVRGRVCTGAALC